MSLELLNTIIGAILPPFIQLVNQSVKNSNWRYVISVVACLVIGAVITFINGQLDFTNVLVSAGLIFASAQTTYKLFWSNTETGKNLMLGK